MTKPSPVTLPGEERVDLLGEYQKFAAETAGKCLALAMSTDHPDPDTVLMGIFHASQDLAAKAVDHRLSHPVGQGVGDVERVAAELAKSDGLDWNEVCGYDAGLDECDSSTCVAAYYEDHDPDVARGNYLKWAKTAIAALSQPIPVASPGYEALRRKKLVMPNGDTLECEYPDSTAWARSWTSRDPEGRAATGEQDWELIERYGLTAILDAVLALPGYEPGLAEGRREVKATIFAALDADMGHLTNDQPLAGQYALRRVKEVIELALVLPTTSGENCNVCPACGMRNGDEGVGCRICDRGYFG